MARTWTSQKIWQDLTPTQKAAAMALLEADSKGGKIDTEAARNALGAMINRAERTGEDLGKHVSQSIYQPTIEPAQFARLTRIINSPEHQDLTGLAERRVAGQEGDWVSGATHFLAPEKTMLALEAREPKKYKNWGPNGANWTGYDPATGEYRGVVMRDSSHAFLAPDGVHQAKPADPFAGRPVSLASSDTIPQSGEPMDPMGGFVRPGEVLPAAAAPSTAIASASPSSTGGAAPSADAGLAGLAAFWKTQEEDANKAEAEQNRATKIAQGAIPKLPGASPMIQGPRAQKIGLNGILAMLKERGVDPNNPGGLGTGGGPLGTRRA